MRPRKINVRPVSDIAGKPFDSVEEAWSWAVTGAAAKLAGARVTAGKAQVNRPCEPFDIIRLAWKLHGQRRLSRQQFRLLLDQDHSSQSADDGMFDGRDYRLLEEALHILVNPLQKRGILA
jgi:hypothetical protein